VKKCYSRIINLENLEDASEEMLELGVYKNDITELSEKSIFRNIKVKNLEIRSANLLKQVALSVGADISFSNDAILMSENTTDVIISASLEQYNKLYHKLQNKQLELPKFAEEIKEVLINYDRKYKMVRIDNRDFDFNDKTYVMGILNLTPDSFSDAGRYFDVEAAVARAKKMVEEGADIIDIGAESTRPGAEYVDVQEELRRILPVVKRLVDDLEVPISIDTYKASVAEECLKIGAHIINDISGLKADHRMAEVISDYNAFCILMHTQGMPKTMQKNPQYEDLVDDLVLELKESIKIAKLAGIKEEKIILDPGIGFGKGQQHNLEIIKRLDEFRSLGYPLLIGASRKSFIGNILDVSVEDRLEGSLAVAAISAYSGAAILRVHDVLETARVLRVTDAIKNSKRR
jgi:dihydropteroate synthase